MALTYVSLQPGDPAPRFIQRTPANPTYNFDTVAGRYIVLCFFVTSRDQRAQSALAAVAANRSLFDDSHFCFFGVSQDAGDEARGELKESTPGIRYFWDFDRSVAKLYGVSPREDESQKKEFRARQLWVVTDPMLRVLKVVPFSPTSDNSSGVFDFLRALPPSERYAGFELPPPILVLSNIFEADLCQKLVALYEKNGGEESGFMSERDGKTVSVHDHARKRRKDCLIRDQELVKLIQRRFLVRVVPEVKRIHYFDATRMERYIVACYDAADNAHFRAHRDNTTKGTAHRRFAVTVNLNADYDGGDLSFPEFGPRKYRAPPGTAIVFSCALMHEVSRVTKGRRFAFLPFLYDDAAAKIREANNEFLDDGIGAYRNVTTDKT